MDLSSTEQRIALPCLRVLKSSGQSLETMTMVMIPTQSKTSKSDGIDFLFGVATPLSFDQFLSQFLHKRNDAGRMIIVY